MTPRPRPPTFFDLDKRHHVPEMMDAPDADPVELERALRFIRNVNKYLGYRARIITHLHRFAQRWKPDEPITMLDFATGSGDIPRGIMSWADKHRFNVRVTGVDLHETTIRLARQENRDPRLTFIRGDVLDLPFEDNSCDYALCAMFLHHLRDDDVVRVLRTMSRVARRGIIVADLHRHRRAYAWINLLTFLNGPMVRHDARVSVAQSFTKPEVLQLRARAGVDYARYFRHFGHRWVLAGEKPG
jgi:ubiquinone/menaquinone biosynthesis C-methylase UbiE